MNKQQEMLEIVDENDQVIGQETRTKIHKEGLLHREIHVFFVTPKKEVIFQHRSKNKETFPDKLASMVGGHVELKSTYEETAIKETEEETGIVLSNKDLVFLTKIRNKIIDEFTNLINYAIVYEYGYLYKGAIENLKIEEGDSYGFEAFTINKLENLSEEEKARFIPAVVSKERMEIYKKAISLLVK
jgi:isopentenyldiphosphate isomerase